MPQNKTIKLNQSTKEKLDSIKSEKQTYDSAISTLITSAAQPKNMTVAVRKQKPQQATAGAGLGRDVTASYAAIMGWVKDLKSKLPKITPEIRREAYAQDGLTRGIITPTLKNMVLSDYEIISKDNKKYAQCIEEQREFVEDIELMTVFRDDFVDYAVLCGHTYRRLDEDGAGIVTKLQRIEPSSTRMIEDPWDSTIRAHHQRILVSASWDITAKATKTVDSWFIPGGGKSNGTAWIAADEPNDPAKSTWEELRQKYNITSVMNLRVDNAEKIMDMHRVREGDAAPIDPAILFIYIKKLIMVNAPNFISRVLFPFVQIENGILTETTLPDGQKTFISSVPEPASSLDPEKNAAQAAAYLEYQTAKENDPKALLEGIFNGGVFSSGPGKKINVIESGRSIQSAFIRDVISLCNNEIGQSVGFPMSLVEARGAELATSGTVLNVINTNYAGSRQEYERKADGIIEKVFAGKVYNYTITLKNGIEESGTYTFEETDSHFKLKTGDAKDAVREAQAALIAMQTLQIAKAIGASRGDVQALADEKGLGILDLDNFDETGQTPIGQGPPGIPGTTNHANIPGAPSVPLKMPALPQEADLKKETVGDLLNSSTPRPPTQEEQLTKDLLATYAEVQKAIEGALKEVKK